MTAKPIDRDALLRDAQRLIDDLRSTGATPGLELGETAPDFELPDATGRLVRLSERLANGPAVIVFYRGAWCPICNVHLRELQDALPLVRALGADLIAISPQAPDRSLAFSHELALGFDVLSDIEQAVIAEWRLQFPLPAAIRDAYTDLGMGLDSHNADGSWNLPVPATFVLDTKATIVARHVDPNYRERMSAADVVAALEHLHGQP